MLLTTTTTNIVDNNKLEPFQTLIGQKLNNSTVVHILPILNRTTREATNVDQNLKEEKSEEEDLINNKNKGKKRLSLNCSDFLLNRLDDSLNALEMVKYSNYFLSNQQQQQQNLKKSPSPSPSPPPLWNEMFLPSVSPCNTNTNLNYYQHSPSTNNIRDNATNSLTTNNCLLKPGKFPVQKEDIAASASSFPLLLLQWIPLDRKTFPITTWNFSYFNNKQSKI
uniref:Uncharacterized protein n=1 Tax=Meloidogyne enterolobii TaxID=390850 RepID=A0A6V7W6G4_MELEN|nr:unnamed protein product [Meloidogyne enterolobii]